MAGAGSIARARADGGADAHHAVGLEAPHKLRERVVGTLASAPPPAPPRAPALRFQQRARPQQPRRHRPPRAPRSATPAPGLAERVPPSAPPRPRARHARAPGPRAPLRPARRRPAPAPARPPGAPLSFWKRAEAIHAIRDGFSGSPCAVALGRTSDARTTWGTSVETCFDSGRRTGRSAAGIIKKLRVLAGAHRTRILATPGPLGCCPVIAAPSALVLQCCHTPRSLRARTAARANERWAGITEMGRGDAPRAAEGRLAPLTPPFATVAGAGGDRRLCRSRRPKIARSGDDVGGARSRYKRPARRRRRGSRCQLPPPGVARPLTRCAARRCARPCSAPRYAVRRHGGHAGAEEAREGELTAPSLCTPATAIIQNAQNCCFRRIGANNRMLRSASSAQTRRRCAREASSRHGRYSWWLQQVHARSCCGHRLPVRTALIDE